MSTVTIGDMSQSFALRLRNVAIKTEMGRLSQEMATGESANLREHLNGSYGPLGSIENSLTALASRRSSNGEAQILAETMQATLGRIQSSVEDLSARFLNVSASNLLQSLDSLTTDTRARFSDIAGQLNQTSAGRSLFAGASTDATALSPGEDMLISIVAAIGAETTAGGIEAIVNDWFTTPGGGFDTLAYQGSTAPLTPLNLGDGVKVDFDIRADNAEFRNILAATALAAVAGDDSLNLSPEVQRSLVKTAGERMLSSQDELTSLRGKVGNSEALIAQSQSRTETETAALQIARNELVSVDSFETATRLENVQFQIESLYAITVRLSRLSLTEYMR